MDILVAAHSGIRWLVLLAMLGVVLLAAQNRKTEAWPAGAIKPFQLSAIVFDIQVALGIILYVADQGWDKGFFFAVIHPLAMLVAVGVWHMFVGRAKKATEPAYRSLLIGGIVSLALVIAAIPWAS